MSMKCNRACCFVTYLEKRKSLLASIFYEIEISAALKLNESQECVKYHHLMPFWLFSKLKYGCSISRIVLSSRSCDKT